MSKILVLKNATIFDGVSEDLIPNAQVIIEDSRIREVSASASNFENADVLNLGGRFLMPGLIDLHFHAYSVTLDMPKLDRMPVPLLVSHAIKLLEGTLQRGFTTVRDPGGGDIGLSLAIESGLVNGPNFFFGGKGLSQTGGHGDMRRGDQVEPCNCAYSGVICQVVDGVDQVRKVCREELRKGADHIKLFITGGVSSPNGPLWMNQFTDGEIRAAVEEAQTCRKYVVAHCHTDEGARRCVENGVRSIEHGTMIKEETAKLIAASGTSYVVPTLAITQLITNHGTELGVYPEGLEKIKKLYEASLISIETCTRAGVKIGLGTDVFGPEYHYMQNHEFLYRAEVNKPIDILRSATSINAEIMQCQDELGTIKAGTLADLIVLEGNPLEDLSLFTRTEQSLAIIMKNGKLIRNRLT